MEQLTIINENSPIKTCAFTGHRELDFTFSAEKLYDTIERLVLKGITTFCCGVAQGFDMLAAETVLFLKRKYSHVKLVACVPFYGQEKYFSVEEKSRYASILKNADETTVIAQHYYKGCYLQRDRYMADRADVLVAYLKKQTGGTAFTVSYFQKKHPEREIIFL